MTGYALAFLMGVLSRLTTPHGAVALVTIASVIVGVGWWMCRWRGTLGLSAWMCAGWCLAWLEVGNYQALRWPEDRTGERVLVEAFVETIPTTSPHGATFDARVTVLTASRASAHCSLAPAQKALHEYASDAAPCQAGRSQSFRARLTWRDRYAPVRAGERWLLLVRLRAPRSHFNPGQLDRELHWFRERVHALGSVVESRLNKRWDTGHYPLTELRQRIVERIKARVPDRDAAALISALAVGSTGDLSRAQWQVFNSTGTTHLVAISGLHVTLFALVAMWLARALWRVCIWRFTLIPRETFASGIGFAAATAYALLAGFSVPTQRTLIMLGVWLIARCSGRACSPLTMISLALMLVLAFDAFAPLAAGFWLSFGAISAIVLITQGRVGTVGWARDALRVQVGVSLALIPVSLASFGSTPIAGVLINVLAIPFFSFLLVPLVLVAPFSDFALASAAGLYAKLWPVMDWASNLPWSSMRAAPSLLWSVGAAIAIAISLMPLPLRLRAACVLWLLPTARTTQDCPPVGGVEMTVLDVGQRTAIAVRTAHHSVFYGDTDAVADYGWSPDMLWVNPSTSRDGSWYWDRVRFDILCPTTFEGLHCVMRITTMNSSLLLTSRLDAQAERHWVRVGLRPANVVIIPRNGSDVASSREFIAAVAAQWALVCGSRFSQGAIKPAVERWSAAGAQVLATADSGAIRLRIHPVTGMLPPETARKKYLALWRASP